MMRNSVVFILTLTFTVPNSKHDQILLFLFIDFNSLPLIGVFTHITDDNYGLL